MSLGRYSTIHGKPGFKRATFRQAYGTPKQASDYCKKDGLFFEKGQMKQTGEKNLMQNQLEEVKKLIETGAPLLDVISANIVVYARFPRFVSTLMGLVKPTIRNDLKVILLYGKPNSGKTYWAYETSPNLYACPIQSTSTLWFPDYNYEKEILVDDFAGEFKLTQLLKFLDKYPVKVETKHGFTWLVATTIYITTNVPWQDWYDYSKRNDSKDALQRRVSHFYYCTNQDGIRGRQETNSQWVSLQRPVLVVAPPEPQSPNLIDLDEDSELELRASTTDWEAFDIARNIVF